MSKKVASVHAEIGADTKGFDAGSKKVKGDLGTLGQEFGRVIPAGVAQFASLSGAVIAVGAALKESVNETVNYNNEVRQLAEVSGSSAEEASRLLQVMDDFKISAEDVNAATRAMTKEGLTPTVDTLAMLSDEYNTLNPGQERADFLMTNFGRTGLKFAEAMSKGGDALRDMSDAVGDGLILTQDGLNATREYELALDSWNDAILTAKVSIGSQLLPALTDILQVLTGTSEETGNVVSKIGALGPAAGYAAARAELAAKTIDSSTQSYMAWGEAAENVTSAYESESDAAARLAEEAKAAADALKEMSDVNNDLLSLTMSISDEMQDYESGLASLLETYSEGSEEVTAFKDAHQAALMQIAVDLEIAKLKADGFTDAEYAMALALLESTGQIDSAAASTALALDQIAAAAQNAGQSGMSAFGDIINKVMEDGVIDSAELQGALDTLNTEVPTEMVTGLQTTFESAAAAGVAGTDEVQSGLNAINTEQAVGRIDALTAALYRIPSKVTVLVDYVTSGTPPPGIEMSQYGFRQL